MSLTTIAADRVFVSLFPRHFRYDPALMRRTHCTIAPALLLLLSACSGGGDRGAPGETTALDSRNGSALLVASDRGDAGLLPPLATTGEGRTITAMGWDFNGRPGRLIASDHYRLFTTGNKPWMHEYAAQFAEEALQHYRTAITDLPPPRTSLDVFLFRFRSEWSDKTREVMGSQAELYLNLGRGGYATRGTAVLYDIGFNDTFAILAHEGWHQYTQVTFRNHLPTWLEEGLATYMEGKRQSPGRPLAFLPWENRPRREALYRAWRRNDLIDLSELLTRSPQQFLEEDSGRLLTYYAQVWAFVHFLVQGDDAKHRAALERVLHDAAEGRLTATVLGTVEVADAKRRREIVGSDLGQGVVLAYFSRDLDEIESAFRDFVSRLLTDPEYEASLRAEFEQVSAGVISE